MRGETKRLLGKGIYNEAIVKCTWQASKEKSIKREEIFFCKDKTGDKASYLSSQHGIGHKINKSLGVLFCLGTGYGGGAFLSTMTQDIHQSNEVDFPP
ncbi:hypothetical protein CEXT_590591 [Caerostris extrusa]|uniref:Uncharacterized protein n=1 Tax=Caerostris extrusa TaxID=172846 RepID=A0AAV4X3N5_CAEEX|nr:hypothetical protein CEXT_590591 [Caerostris extrusa]